MRNKAEAAELIDRLRRLRGPSPLDPYELDRRGRRAGAEAGDDWKSAHYSLLAGLRLDLQQYINSTLDSLRAQMSDSFGPGGARQEFGPKNLVREARIYLERLRVWSKYGSRNGAPMPEPDNSAPAAAQGESPPGDGDRELHPEGRDDVTATPIEKPYWLGLIRVLALYVLIESVVNTPLLMGALRSGMVQAFVLAVLVSLINVGGLGISAGLLLSWIRRQRTTNELLYRSVWMAWAIVAIGFNLIAGRHRESYTRVVEAVRQNPTAIPPSPQELLPSVGFNPLAWDFQALLFALLGMILCALGLAKGFTFIKETESPYREFDDAERRTGRPTEVEDNSDFGGVVGIYGTVLSRFQSSITELRSVIADWHGRLDQKRRDIDDTVSMLAQEENRRACIDVAEHAFIAAYNDGHPDKIHLSEVRSHRKEKHSEPILVAPSDEGIVQEAARVVSEWRESTQSEFESRIADAQDEIVELWRQYEPLVLGGERREA